MNAHTNPPVLERAPPASIPAEQAVLGTLLMRNDLFQRIAGILKREHFFEELHARIFEVTAELIASGKTASVISLPTFLGNHDLGNGMTIVRYLAQLSAECGNPAHVVDYAVCVRDLAARRQMIAVAETLIGKAYDLPVQTTPASIASDATTEFLSITSTGAVTDTMRDPGNSAAALIQRATDLRDKKISDAGATTGISALDRSTGGFQPGALWVVGARPGMGKSIMMTSCSLKAARAGSGVLDFSLEISEPQFVARMLSDLAYDANRRALPFGNILRGYVSNSDIVRLDDASRILRELPISVDFASRLTVAQITMRVRAEKKRMAEKGQSLRVIFLDYLKMIQASDRYRGNRVYEVGEISGGLKQLAKDEEICVVLLAQLNRGLENREDKRPQLSDLRESGDLEADADVVAFIHREAYFLERSPDLKSTNAEKSGIATALLMAAQGKMELIIGKNRAGPMETLNLLCEVGASRIDEDPSQTRAEGF
jgi:replicative DNA helicase